VEEHSYTTYADRFRRRNSDGTWTTIRNKENEVGDRAQIVKLLDAGENTLVVWHIVYSAAGTVRHLHEEYRRADATAVWPPEGYPG
jgi:hypothetical protein